MRTFSFTPEEGRFEVKTSESDSLEQSYLGEGKTCEKSFLSLGNSMVLSKVDEETTFLSTCGALELYFSKISIS